MYEPRPWQKAEFDKLTEFPFEASPEALSLPVDPWHFGQSAMQLFTEYASKVSKWGKLTPTQAHLFEAAYTLTQRGQHRATFVAQWETGETMWELEGSRFVIAR